MGAVWSICFEWSAISTLDQAISIKNASFRRLRSLTPWAIQDSREYLVRTKKFAIKEHIQCKFEGLGSSERCRCEDFKQQKGQAAITGLHSNWVTDSILATARPSDALITDYNVLEQFEKCDLGAIFNLQEPGEHGDCGPGIKVESGFSYTPELLMKNKIFYYNFPWRDMTCPGVDYTLNIVAVMDFHISRGTKVAVHCHSGLGRTGLVIACYLVYTGQKDAVSAVEHVRMYRFATITKTSRGILFRPGALQTKQQVLHVKEFEDYLVGLKMVYVQPWQSLDHLGTRGHPTLELLMARQRKILHGEESRILRYTPKVLVYIVREISKRIIADKSKREEVATAFLKGLSWDFTPEKDRDFVRSVQEAKRKLNAGNWEVVSELDIQVLMQLFLDWLHLLKDPIIPDAALSKALTRGEIQAANYELKKGGKCCFYTVRLLACWMLQVAPAEKTSRRRLFSGLAHLLLEPSTLQGERKTQPGAYPIEPSGAYSGSPRRSSSSSPRGTYSPELSGVYSEEQYYKRRRESSRFCPSMLEVEVGLLLEAAAKYWCKVLLGQRNLGPVSSISSKLKTNSSDELWSYDKAGVESDICTGKMEVEEAQNNYEDVQLYMSAVCVEQIINEVTSGGLAVLPSETSSGLSTPNEY